MSWRARPDADRVIANMGVSGRHVRHWRRALQSIDAGRVDTWDWQWYFSMAAGSLVAIVPEVNLVSNVGFGNEATHTRGTAKPQFVRRYELRLPLKHPPTVQVDDAFDEAFEAFAMPSRSQRLLRRVQDKLRHVLLRLHGAVVPAPIDPFPDRPEVFFRYGYAPIDQLKALENLRDLSEQLQIIGLKHWIFFGTLLGAVRENRLIPWDEDTDLAILEEELPLLLEPAALQRLEQAGFVLARWRNGLISFIRDGQYTDLYAFRKICFSTRYWSGYRVPEVHFSDEVPTFSDARLPAPLFPEKLLRRWYGRNWRTPMEKRPASSAVRKIRRGIAHLASGRPLGSRDTPR